MKWFAVISCIYSHTFGGVFYCSIAKDQEIDHGWKTESECERWAIEWLNTKYNVHRGEYEWGYKCVLKNPPTPYQSKKLP